MKKKSERAQTLLGLFLPHFWPKVKEAIMVCELVSEATKSINPEEIVRLDFDFKRGDRVKVYREFVHAITKGWMAVNVTVLSDYLAENSNLSTNSDSNIRRETIRRLIGNYKEKYT